MIRSEGPTDDRRDWRERLLLAVAQELERRASLGAASPELLRRWAARIRRRLFEGDTSR